MSYCRWSSMNWRCDVYVYEDVSGGWTTHVAGRRRIIQPIPDIPLGWLPRFGATWSKETRKVVYPSKWHKRAAHMMFSLSALWHKYLHQPTMDLIPLRPIGLPHDGDSFNDGEPGECANRLESLRAMGYIVPQHAIDALREEQIELLEATGNE